MIQTSTVHTVVNRTNSDCEFGDCLRVFFGGFIKVNQLEID